MSRRPAIQHSPASRALALILAGKDEPEKALAAKLVDPEHEIHRTELWRYSTGRVTPSAERASLIHHLTEGRVPADAWEAEGVRSVEDAAPEASGAPATTFRPGDPNPASGAPNAA